MSDFLPFVYEIDGCTLSMNRDYAIEHAKYYANKRNEPITIAVRLHGSAKRICELTIYPDNAERLDDGC